MPGMTELSSTIALAETGVDMDIFDDAKHLCSWCGLSPANNVSAGKKLMAPQNHLERVVLKKTTFLLTLKVLVTIALN